MLQALLHCFMKLLQNGLRQEDVKCREMRKESLMKAKRVVGVLAALLLCICMIMPVNTDAAAQVRVRTVKGVTSSYT